MQFPEGLEDSPNILFLKMCVCDVRAARTLKCAMCVRAAEKSVATHSLAYFQNLINQIYLK
jgi:hypothetical protein